MQPLTAPPRQALTAGQVTTLIRDASAVIVSPGCELIDMGLNVIEDISGDLASGSVSRNSYATLHGTATLNVSRDLDWGTAIVRPYMTMTDGVISARFNLGAYFTSTPRQQAETSPPTHEVRGYDILHALNSSTGTAYAVGAGTSYLVAIETVLVDQGYLRYSIDRAAGNAALASPMVWLLADNPTWLGIVNDLLGAIGYAGVWSDWDGVLRLAPYQTPRDRGAEWLYDTGGLTSMPTPQRFREFDYFDAPNRWVFYRSAAVDGPTPVEGDGIFTFTNENDGPTSVARRGRVITAQPQAVEAVDQASLVAQARIRIDADLRLKTTIGLGTAPNPLHWHFDRIRLDDPVFGPPMECLTTQWTLPLDGGDQQHEWTLI